MTDDPRDTELERVFRQGLRRAAGRAEVGVPLAGRAHAGARTRRRRRWATVGAVAAVVAVSGVAVAVQSGGDPDRRPTDHAAADPTTAAPITEWRAESWHGLTVDVPADWGWGAAPITLGDDGPLMCGGPGASMSPVTAVPGTDTPYVGRPVMLSDACQGGPLPAPEAAYTWLGADVEPGTTDLGDGYTQETVEAFGTTLTVATQNPALRRQILESARATTDCDAQLPSRPEVIAIPIEGLDPVHSAQLCAYQESADGFDLVYASTLGQDSAQYLYGGDGLGTKSARAFCGSKFEEYVRISFSGKDAMGDAELTADWVVDPGCQQVEIGPGHVLPLKDSGMGAWAKDGVQVILRSFIGMLG